MINTEEITIDQKGCARCHGEGHKKITFKKFTHPLANLSAPDGVLPTHWALCPTNGEPILMSIRPKKE